MRLTVVGSGTAAPHPRRVQSAVLIECDNVRLLVDCGSGAVFRMAQLGLDWQSITHVALTHFHADHCADFPNLVFAWRYGMLPARTAPVTLVGPTGTTALIERLNGLFHLPVSGASPPLALDEIAPSERRALSADVMLEAFKVAHTVESIAYGVSWRGRRVVVSGDLGYDPSFASWAAGADVLVLECSLPSTLAIPMHLSPEQCAQVAASASPACLVLTHFYPPVESVDIVSVVRARYTGATVLADDGWSCTLEPARAAAGTSAL
jgi:ribonuclease BN (tRNA processing enzyme)